MANPNLPTVRVFVAFNSGPGTTATPVWTELTARMQEFSTSRGRQYELDQVQAGTCTMTLLDADEALNPANPSSPYAGNLLPYRQIIVQAQWPPTTAQAGGPNLCSLIDPGFEAAAVGGTPAGDWNYLLYAGAAISTTQAWQGTHSLSFGISGTGVLQGFRWKLACTPGTQYTFSTYVYQTAPGNSLQIGLANGLSDSNLTFTSVGTPTSTTGTWTRISLTFTATQPKHNLWMVTQSPSNTNTVYVDAIQLEQAGAPSTWSASGPGLYFLFGGYVERWPSAWWYAGNMGYAEITCVDALALLSQQALHSEVTNTILAMQPAYYWPLWEAQGASSFAEASGNNGPQLTPVVSPYGSGQGLNPGQSSAIVGDPSGAAVQFYNDGTGSRTQTGTTIGAGLYANATTGTAPIPTNPAAPWSVSAVCWVHADVTTSPSNGTPLTLYTFAGTVPSSSFSHITPLVLFVTGADGHPYLDYQSVSAQTGMNYEINGTSSVWDGNWHMLAGVVTQDTNNTTLTLYVDGLQVATGTVTNASLGGMLSAPATNIQVGGELYPASQINMWPGEVAHVAVWQTALTAAQISTLWSASGGYWGEYSGTRVSRLATLFYPLPVLTDTGSSVMGASNSANGSYCLDVLNDVAISEVGTLFADASGTIQFKGRNSRFLQTVALWTFGENAPPLGTETPYLEGVAYDYDPTHVYNDIEITRDGGIVVHITDATSQTAYFDRQLTQTVYIAGDQETIDHAGYLLNKYRQPVQRLNGLSVDAAANPAAFPVVLGAELNQRLTVKRRTRPFTMSDGYFLEKIDHTVKFDEPSWTTSFEASPADRQQAWIIGDAVYGVLDSTTVLAF